MVNKRPAKPAGFTGKAARGRRAGAWGLDGKLGEAWGQPSPAPFRRILLRRRLGCGEIVAVGKGWRGVPSGIPIMLGAGWGTSRPRQWHGTPPRAPVPRVRQHCKAARGEPSIGGTTASATAPEGTGPAPSPCYTTAVIVSSSRQRRCGAAERLNDDLGYDGSASTFLLGAQDEKSGSSIEGPQRHRGLFAFPPHSPPTDSEQRDRNQDGSPKPSYVLNPTSCETKPFTRRFWPRTSTSILRLKILTLRVPSLPFSVIKTSKDRIKY